MRTPITDARARARVVESRAVRASLPILLVLAACGGEPDLKDQDFQRHLAKPMPLNKVYTDSVAFELDDKSDWKIFHVDQPGLLTVRIVFDTPNGTCEAYLRDKYGAHVAREVQSNNPYLDLVRRVEPGRFFIWIHAPDEKCSTKYSLEARLDPD